MTTELDFNNCPPGLEPADAFESMGLRENVLRGLFSYGFEKPSEIQAKAIPFLITKRDIIAQAQSGTGKTATFVTGALQNIDEDLNKCQGIIIAPVRELAYQIADVITHLGQHTKVKSIVCVGGDNINESRKQLEHGNNIVVGTPGRILDMIERGYLKTVDIKILILDEADELLSRSFIDQIKNIVQTIPKTTQICVFSATMPLEALDITRHFLVNPSTILVEPQQLTLDGITQFYIDVGQERYKFETFCDLYDMVSVSQSMVYVNTKDRAERLREDLLDKNFTVSVIHSGMRSTDRNEIMKDFRKGKTRILVSTDLLSRGIDIQQVSIVINYDLPKNNESYLHRIGRSGRFGRKGVAINLVSRQDFWRMRDIERHYSIVINKMPSQISNYL